MIAVVSVFVNIALVLNYRSCYLLNWSCLSGLVGIKRNMEVA